jgi:hypothetical protein
MQELIYLFKKLAVIFTCKGKMALIHRFLELFRPLLDRPFFLFLPRGLYIYISFLWFLSLFLPIFLFRNQIIYFFKNSSKVLKRYKKEIFLSLLLFFIAFFCLFAVYGYGKSVEDSPYLIMSSCMVNIEHIYYENPICQIPFFGDEHEFGYPALLSFFMRLFYPSVLIYAFVPLVFSALGIVFLYLFFRSFFSIKKSFISALIFLFIPFNLRFLSTSTKEPIHFFFLSVFLFLSVLIMHKKIQTHQKWLFYFWIGWLYVLAVEVKAQLIFLLPVLAFVMFMSGVRRMKYYAALLIPFVLTLPYKFYMFLVKFGFYSTGFTFEIIWNSLTDNTYVNFIMMAFKAVSFNWVFFSFLVLSILIFLFLAKLKRKELILVIYLIALVMITGVFIFLWDVWRLSGDVERDLNGSHHFLIFSFVFWILLLFFINKQKNRFFYFLGTALIIVLVWHSFPKDYVDGKRSILEKNWYFTSLDRMISEVPNNVTLYYTHFNSIFWPYEYQIIPSIKHYDTKPFFCRWVDDGYDFSSCNPIVLFGRKDENDIILNRSVLEERSQEIKQNLRLFYSFYVTEDDIEKVFSDIRAINSCDYLKKVDYDSETGAEVVYLYKP